jgi:hypothetical protein
MAVHSSRLTFNWRDACKRAEAEATPHGCPSSASPQPWHEKRKAAAPVQRVLFRRARLEAWPRGRAGSGGRPPGRRAARVHGGGSEQRHRDGRSDAEGEVAGRLRTSPASTWTAAAVALRVATTRRAGCSSSEACEHADTRAGVAIGQDGRLRRHDWRLKIELDAPGDGFSFMESVRDQALERDARKRLGHRVGERRRPARLPLHRHRGDGARCPAGRRTAPRPARAHRQRHVARPLAP